MDKATFRKLLAEGKTKLRKPKAGSVNWKLVKARAVKTGGVYTTKQFWKRFVKGKVNKGRTKLVLHKWCDEDKIVARIWTKKGYVWCFDKDTVKEYFEVLQQQTS